VTARGPQIVVVGASLGGLFAVQELLGGLPRTFRCPLVIAQHRRAEADSRLLDLLQLECTLPVVEPDDKQPILEGHIYLAPADYHLLVERDHFALNVDPPVCYSRPSIDVLFESAAYAFGADVLAVMLTGSTDDGARGAAAVKRAGGHVIVQDPKTAESPVAPLAVLGRTEVDGVYDMPEVAPRLVQLCSATQADL
jgi:two-component system chemotaxis response regulator CheB